MTDSDILGGPKGSRAGGAFALSVNISKGQNVNSRGRQAMFFWGDIFKTVGVAPSFLLAQWVAILVIFLSLSASWLVELHRDCLP